MNNLEIIIDKQVFSPGEAIRGSINWQLEKPPKLIYLQIGWQTDGKGTQDHRVEYETQFHSDFQTGKECFNFVLPVSPYSFFGKLIELTWFIETRAKIGNAVSAVDIIVAPKGKPVQLPLK